VISLVVWGLIAVWTQVRVYELLRTWQKIAVDVPIVSGLVMLALLVYAAWERLSRYCRLVPWHVRFYNGNSPRRAGRSRLPTRNSGSVMPAPNAIHSSEGSARG
jgi:hypothetical protein